MPSILTLSNNQFRVGWKCLQCDKAPKHNSVIVEPEELEFTVQCHRGHETRIGFTVADKYRQEFNRGRRLKSVYPIEEIQWLLGRDTDLYLRASYWNYVRCFVDQDTHDKILTLQPYPPYPFNNQPLDKFVEQARTESEKFADEHGLTVRVTGHSWYNPGHTILIEYAAKKGGNLASQEKDTQ